MNRKLRLATEFLIVASIIVIGFILFSSEGGGIGHFSPDSLVSKSQSRGYLSRPHPYLDELTDYLIKKGYWSPELTTNPRWIYRFSWTPGTRDGESFLERHLFWRRKQWIDWTEEHPESAAVLWPRILSLLRGKNLKQGELEAVELLMKVRFADTDQELAKALATEK